MAVFDQPFAISRYSAVSEDTAGNITLVSVAGNMTTSLPNATETITSNSNGNFTLAFTKAGAIQEGKVHLTTSDGMEEATITLTGFLPADNTIGIGIAMFAANPGGRLASIDNFVAITLYSSQPDNSTQIQFFDWQGGGRKDPANSQSLSDNIGGSNPTATPPAANRNGEVISVSIVQGATGQGGQAFSPNAVQAKVGDTVIWTNDDTTPHTVTSGSEGQPNGKFDSSPNLSPLMASGKTFDHTFEDAGEYAYYCQLHPNMVGIVSVG
jgi:plastocyanin